MSDITRYERGVPVVYVDNGDGTYSLKVAAAITGSGDATAANQEALLSRVGEVQASPTANTLLDRLKVIDTSLQTVIGLLGTSLATQVWKSANYTAAQTGVALWTPGAGKKIAITSLVIGTYGTTQGRVHVWFGGSGDTTYTAGTDQLVVAATFSPSATSTPGLVLAPPSPILAATADHVLRLTTSAGLSIDLTIYGYEF